MKTYTLIGRGSWHPVFCEDFLFSRQISNELFVGAVFDGCSSGKDAHFASALMGKIVKQSIAMLLYQSDFDQLVQSGVQSVGKKILQMTFEELKVVRNLLLLDREELLSTMLLMVCTPQQCYIIALGDGCIALNGEFIRIDQDNRPDYPVYHIEEDFEQWYASQTNIFLLDRPRDVSIATDGIDSFEHTNPAFSNAIDPIHYLLFDRLYDKEPDMLERKFNGLSRNFGCDPGDDISVIRVRF